MRWDSTDGALDVTNLTSRALVASVILVAESGWLMGMTAASIDDTNALDMDVFDGADAQGGWLFNLRLPIGATTRQSPGLPGMPVERGLFVAVNTGTVDLSMTFGKGSR